jgi:hypothetical protein
MKTTKEYTSWETIQKLYPDRFVLLENPEFDSMRGLKGGIFLYKNKSRKKVFQKDMELRPRRATILYTGGIRGDRVNENVLIL